MATFTYIKKDGSQGTIEAPDSGSAIKMLPSDANPRSGVMSSLSGTGTPSPSNGGAGTDSGNSSPLASFASSLDAAVNLARASRNKSSLDIMKPYRGKVAASDFNSILSNLNAASDRTSSDLIKRATEVEKPPEYKLVQNDNGDVTALDPVTGQIAWALEISRGVEGAGVAYFLVAA